MGAKEKPASIKGLGAGRPSAWRDPTSDSQETGAAEGQKEGSRLHIFLDLFFAYQLYFSLG